MNTPTQPTPITLSDEQNIAMEMILNWHQSSIQKREFRLGGFAGTGKTTLLKELKKHSDKIRFAACAFTGKAADVLTRKGVSASTIHSLIYDVEVDKGEYVCTLKPRKEVDWVDLFVVDEASMISTELYKDLSSYNIPILFVGDPGQLEPVGDNPNLMKKCDYVLSTIHRQALDNPIIAYSQHIRNGGVALYRQFEEAGKLSFTNKNISGELMHSVDQIICAKNATRENFNKVFRKNMNYTDPIHVGEKMICLQNNAHFGTFNGQMFTITKVLEESADAIEVEMTNDNGNTFKVPVWSDPFYRPMAKTDFCPRKKVYLTYGYCITCHKSQGSEWDHVLVIDEWMPPKIWDMARWRYTAVTRAAQQLTYAI